MGQLIQLENFARLKPYAGMFAEGLAITVLLALFTVLIGFILALLLALMRMSNFRPFRALGLNRDGHLRDGGFLLTLSKFNPLSFIATAYVEVIRSTPMMVQILIIYLGVFSVIQLPKFSIFGFIESQRFIPGVVALGMNSGAYLCEIIRSGIQSIDGGQTEAARSLGLSPAAEPAVHYPATGSEEYFTRHCQRVRGHHQGVRHYFLPVLPHQQDHRLLRKENEPWRPEIS